MPNVHDQPVVSRLPASGALQGLLFLLGGCLAASAWALDALPEAELSTVTGEGLGILPENIRIVFDDTAYVRALPRGAPASGSGVAGGQGNVADLFWYGLAFSGADGNLNNRVGGLISSWGTSSNPWTFLATSPTFFLYNNTGSTATNAAYPVLRYAAPRYTAAGDFTSASVMALKYAFFGDIVACGAGTPTYGSTTICGGLTQNGTLRSISVWDGFSFHGSQYNIFQSTVDYGKYMGNAAVEFLPVVAGGSAADDKGTFGAVWLNRINSNTTGVLRFGLGGYTGSGAVPETSSRSFNANEGIYITDLDINMPVGHLHYQPLIFDNDASGNLILEVVRIPNNSAIYGYAYRDYSLSGAADLAKMCTNATVDCANATHGELRMGKVAFKNSAGTEILGSRGAAGTASSVSIEGIFLQHVKVKTLGL